MRLWKAAWGGAALLLSLVPSAPAAADDEDVVLSDDRFSPREVDIRPGDTVTWRHRDDDTPHSVTFEDGYDPYQGCAEPDIFGNCMTEGDSTQRTFLLPGTFRYYCRIHQQSGMTGVINVVGAAGSGTSTSTTQPGLGSGTTSTSSSTSTTTPLVVSTSTTRPAVVASIPTTTTTPRPNYQNLPRGSAPALDTDAPSNEDQLAAFPAPAEGGSGGGGAGGGDDSLGVVAAAVVALAGAGGVLAWKFRPRGRVV